MNRLHSLTGTALDRLIKQIHRDNQGPGLFIRAPYDVNDANEPLTEMWTESMKVEREATEMPDNLVNMPEVFKNNMNLHSKKGQANIPLILIIRENDLPVPESIYATLHNPLVDSAILHGPESNANNGIVHDLLQSLTLNGPAWSWINAYQRNRDGRGAWK
jgi:hypothetical protein